MDGGEGFEAATGAPHTLLMLVVCMSTFFRVGAPSRFEDFVQVSVLLGKIDKNANLRKKAGTRKVESL